jgi:NADH-quinone oxidoreductase subunit G
VLGNVLDLEGFEYESSEQVRDELHRACEGVGTDTSQHGNCYTTALDVGLMRVADVPIYSTDALVRRSPALQKTGDAASFLARISHAQAAQLGLSDGESVSVVQGDARQVCTVVTDTRVPESTVWLSCGTAKAAMLGASIGPVSLEKGSGEGML